MSGRAVVRVAEHAPLNVDYYEVSKFLDNLSPLEPSVARPLPHPFFAGVKFVAEDLGNPWNELEASAMENGADSVPLDNQVEMQVVHHENRLGNLDNIVAANTQMEKPLAEKVDNPLDVEGLPWEKPVTIFDIEKGVFCRSELYKLLDPGSLTDGPVQSGLKQRLRELKGDLGRLADRERIFPIFQHDMNEYLRTQLEKADCSGAMSVENVKGIFEEAFTLFVSGSNEALVGNMRPDLTQIRVIDDSVLVANFDVEISPSPVELPVHREEKQYPKVHIPTVHYEQKRVIYGEKMLRRRKRRLRQGVGMLLV